MLVSSQSYAYQVVTGSLCQKKLMSLIVFLCLQTCATLGQQLECHVQQTQQFAHPWEQGCLAVTQVRTQNVSCDACLCHNTIKIT